MWNLSVWTLSSLLSDSLLVQLSEDPVFLNGGLAFSHLLHILEQLQRKAASIYHNIVFPLKRLKRNLNLLQRINEQFYEKTPICNVYRNTLKSLAQIMEIILIFYYLKENVISLQHLWRR